MGDANSKTEAEHIRKIMHLEEKRSSAFLAVHCWLEQCGDLDAGSGSPKWLNEEN